MEVFRERISKTVKKKKNEPLSEITEAKNALHNNCYGFSNIFLFYRLRILYGNRGK